MKPTYNPTYGGDVDGTAFLGPSTAGKCSVIGDLTLSTAPVAQLAEQLTLNQRPSQPHSVDPHRISPKRTRNNGYDLQSPLQPSQGSGLSGLPRLKNCGYPGRAT